MRKLFSILAVALFALSAHATVVTKDITLSGFNKDRENGISWNTETQVVTAENNEWPAIQKWETIETTDYEEIVLELADASSVGINLWVRYSDESESDITIPAGETSKELALKALPLSAIKIRVTAAGSATLSKLYLKGVAGKVKEEAVAFDQYNNDGALGSGEAAWGNSLQAWSGHFSNIGLQVDDKLVIKYTLSGSDDQFRILACAESDNVFDFASSNGSCVDPEAGTTSIAFSLNSADLALLTSKGLKIDGKNMTITGISVLKHALIWHKEEGVTTGNWANDVALNDFSDFKDGNKLCIRLSALTVGDWAQVALLKDYDAFDPELKYVFQDGDAASDENPYIVEFPITNTMLHQLQGKYLRVRGKNFTMTDIYVKEGTPTNKVAAYLNVSDAGMATYVLPFDVTELPDGVQAYELTNDGSDEIVATPITSLAADKPVLIVAAEGEYEFAGEEGASADISGKTGTYANGALVGTYQSIDPLAQKTDANFNYVLQKHEGDATPVFYQVLDDACYIASYRAYLSCGHNANAGGPGMAPKMRLVFNNENHTTGVERVQSSVISSQKILRNGQILIIRDNKMFNVLGQQL